MRFLVGATNDRALHGFARRFGKRVAYCGVEGGRFGKRVAYCGVEGLGD